MEARNHHNPMLLNFEENSVGKAAYSRTPASTMDDGELQWALRDCLNGGLDCQRETVTKLRANVVIPRPHFQQILVRFRRPDDWKCHGFLNRPALICSHGMTSVGFCSCCVIR